MQRSSLNKEATPLLFFGYIETKNVGKRGKIRLTINEQKKMSERELVKDILEGDRDKFRFIADKYKDVVFRTAIGYLHSSEDAQDITQEVLIKVYSSLDKFKFDSSLSTWIYRITINTCINQIRREKTSKIFRPIEHIGSLLSPHSNDKDPHERVEQSETEKKIVEAMNSLPNKQRTAFILSKYHDMSQKEVASIMELSEGSVEQLLQRAKKGLKKKLTK